MRRLYANYDWLTLRAPLHHTSRMWHLLPEVAGPAKRATIKWGEVSKRTEYDTPDSQWLSEQSVEVQSHRTGAIALLGPSFLVVLDDGHIKVEFWGRHFASGQMPPLRFLDALDRIFRLPPPGDWTVSRLDMAADFATDEEPLDEWWHPKRWTGVGTRTGKLSAIASKANGVETLTWSPRGIVTLQLYRKDLQLRNPSVKSMRKIYERLWRGRGDGDMMIRVELRFRGQSLRELGINKLLHVRREHIKKAWAYGVEWARPNVAIGARGRDGADPRWRYVAEAFGVLSAPTRDNAPQSGSTPQQAAGVLRSMLRWHGMDRHKVTMLNDAQLLDECKGLVETSHLPVSRHRKRGGSTQVND